MEQELVSMQEIMDKIKDVDRLPSYEEAERLLHLLEDRSHRDYSQRGWFGFCQEHGVHNVYNTEFIDALADEIRRLNYSPIVEICAGDGKLSHQLRKRGIDIKPTDNYSWDLSKDGLVEKLSHQEALKKYEPRVVLASWIPYQARIGFDVLDSPSVRYFIDIGEDVGGATWMTEEIYDRKDWDRKYLENVGENSICRTDYQDNILHSCVSLFSRKDASHRK